MSFFNILPPAIASVCLSACLVVVVVVVVVVVLFNLAVVRPNSTIEQDNSK